MPTMIHFGWCYVCNHMTSWSEEGSVHRALQSAYGGEARPHQCGGYSIPWTHGVRAYREAIEKGLTGTRAMEEVYKEEMTWRNVQGGRRDEILAVIAIFKASGGTDWPKLASKAVNELVLADDLG